MIRFFCEDRPGQLLLIAELEGRRHEADITGMCLMTSTERQHKLAARARGVGRLLKGDGYAS